MKDTPLRVGLVADTHDLLRPELLAFLRGCARILHAGDIAGPAVLEALAALAPLTAVRGNNDRGAWAAALDETATVELGGVRIHVRHDSAGLDRAALRADGVRVVVTGHSHRAGSSDRDGLLHVNPGSAGPRRFRLPVSAAELFIADGRVTARIAEFDVAPRR